MRRISKYFVLIALCIFSKANAQNSCPQDYDFAHFTCLFNTASHLGKLLHDHRYTDALTLSTSSCKADLKSSFTTPAELERFFTSYPATSVGAPPDIITRCNSSDLLPGPKRDEEVKASIAEYYTDIARLNNSVKETLQSIAAIDSLKSKPILSGVDCSIPELKSSVDFCATLRSACQPKGGNFELATKTKQNLIEKKKLLEQIRWINQNPSGPVRITGTTHNGPIRQHNLSDDQKVEVEETKKKIAVLEDDTPAIRDDSVAMKEINEAAAHNFDRNPDNPENISKLSDETISKAVWDNHSYTRELLIDRLNKLRSAASCLGGRGDCSNFDEVMEMDASTEIPYLNVESEVDHRTQKGLRAFNAGLCQSQARRKARQHGKMGNSVTAALGLTAASLFIPPLAESAGIAWAGAFAIRSIDTYYAIDAGLEAYKKCQPQLDQFHIIIRNEAKAADKFCPKSFDQPKAIALKNVYECEKGIAMVIPAAAPLVTSAAKDVALLTKGTDSIDTKTARKLASAVAEADPRSYGKFASKDSLTSLYGDSFNPERYEADVARDGPSAFVVGGRNTSENIEKATGVTGLDWKTLDERAKAAGATALPDSMNKLLGVKPSGYWEGASYRHLRSSGDGFIANGQTVKGLLLKDNDWVMQHGLSHQEISDPLIRALKQFENQNEKILTGPGGLIKKTTPLNFEYNGNDYTIESAPVGGWYGNGDANLKSGPVGHSELQGSFFNDNYFTNYAIVITNKKTGQKLITDGLTPYLIHRYGFYQGGPYRLAPEAIANFFELSGGNTVATSSARETTKAVNTFKTEGTVLKSVKKTHSVPEIGEHLPKTENPVLSSQHGQLSTPLVPSTSKSELSPVTKSSRIEIQNLLNSTHGVPEIAKSQAVMRYWNDPDVILIKDAILANKKLSTIREPFRLALNSKKVDGGFIITVNTLAGKEHVRFFGNIVLLNRQSKGFDSSLPKLITAILKAASEAKAADPSLHFITIEAPSLVNKDLIGKLREYGFKDLNDPGFLKSRVIGEHTPLQLNIDFIN